MKEALKKDRARIQMGRITGFGLMEISRQRLRSSLLETGHHICPMCQGTGFVRSAQSCAMHVLHILEETGQQHKNHAINITVPLEVALYVLNNKRDSLAHIENRYDVEIKVNGDASMVAPIDYRLEYNPLPVKEKKGFFARTIESLLPSKTEEVAEPVKKENKKKKQAKEVAPVARKEAAPEKNKKSRHSAKKRAKKNAPLTTGEDKFKVVHQEAMVLYDSHANSLVAPQEEKSDVVAVEPAKTQVEAVAKPKRGRKKASAQKAEPKKATKVENKAEKVVDSPVAEPTAVSAENLPHTENLKKGWWNK